MEQKKLQELQKELLELRKEFNAKLDVFDQEIIELAEQKTQIDASSNYASRIQKALLPSIEILNKNLNDFFIFYHPRDIVSGDFYWMTHRKGKTIVAAVDCTGHGVPGAFISMLGISFLNQVVNNEQIYQPDEILNKLRYYIVKNLQQKGLPGETNDGFDMAIISIDKNTGVMEFAGANNPVYIVRRGELLETKGDKMPIAINNRMDPFTKTFHEFSKYGKEFLLKQDELHPFTNHQIEIEKGDCIYIFSDGYADQFGGSDNRKFMTRNFKKLLETIGHEPMNIQREKLKHTHDVWKGEYEQVDDMLVIGIQI